MRVGGGVFGLICQYAPSYPSCCRRNKAGVAMMLTTKQIGGLTAILLSLISIPDAKFLTTKATFYEQLKRLDLPGFLIFAPTCTMLLLAVEWGGVLYSVRANSSLSFPMSGASSLLDAFRVQDPTERTLKFLVEIRNHHRALPRLPRHAHHLALLGALARRHSHDPPAPATQSRRSMCSHHSHT